MTSQGNCFDDLIGSFKIICSSLERKAELSLKEIEKECIEEFASSVKSLQKFDEMVSAISKTCYEVIKNNEILKQASEKNIGENFISLPYEMHGDFVKCVNELYNMVPLGKSVNEENLIDGEKKQLVQELIKTGEKNIHDMKELESAIIEAKEIF